jgi:hypothetical protein
MKKPSKTADLIRFVKWMNKNSICGKYLTLLPSSIVDCYQRDQAKPIPTTEKASVLWELQ